RALMDNHHRHGGLACHIRSGKPPKARCSTSAKGRPEMLPKKTRNHPQRQALRH
ncbi:hypothetical protein FRC11_011584, partial [Ceratobasidium sp. 423]